MPASKVYFTSARCTVWDSSCSLPFKYDQLLLLAGLKKYISPKEKVAVKIHFGSQGCFRTVRPVFVRKTVDAIKAAGGRPFVTDTTRIDSLEYLEVAAYNGYTHLTCGAPVIIADGLFGKDAVTVKVPGAKHIQEIDVASAIYHADAMVVLSHFKGHIQAGFGGAIKNMGMGGVSPFTHCGHNNRGRLHSVSATPPEWQKGKCTFCGRCEKVCPTKSISIKGKESLKVNKDLCWICGRCARICPAEALAMPITSERLAIHIAEASKAVISTFKPKKIIYVNFIMEVQPECDCMPVADTPVVQDQGILISDDLVAVDRASLDMVNRAKPLPQSRAEDYGLKEAGEVLSKVNKRDTNITIEQSEKYGLGSSNYELVEFESEGKAGKSEEHI